MLFGLGLESEFSPRLEFGCTVLEENMLACREQCRQLLSPLPPPCLCSWSRCSQKDSPWRWSLGYLTLSSGSQNMSRSIQAGNDDLEVDI